MSVANYLKCTLSNNSCPQWPECQHTSRIRIAGAINRTIMIMNHCQTHLWWPTFHSWHWSLHHDEYVETSNLFPLVVFMCYFQSCSLNCPINEPARLWIIGVFHLTVHVVSLNPPTFEDNLYLGHTEVCVSVGVVWAYSKGLPRMERWIVMEKADYLVFEIL